MQAIIKDEQGHLNDTHRELFKARTGDMVYGTARVDEEKVAQLEQAVAEVEGKIGDLQERAAKKRAEHVLVADSSEEGSLELQVAQSRERSAMRLVEASAVGTHKGGIHAVDERSVTRLREEKEAAARDVADASTRASTFAAPLAKHSEALEQEYASARPTLSSAKRKELAETRRADTIVQAIELKKREMCIHGVRCYGKDAIKCRWCDPKKAAAV